jgi:hypothetical protein
MYFLRRLPKRNTRTLQAKEYLPEVTLTFVQRVPQWYWGISSTSSYVEQTKAVDSWVTELHYQTETALAPFFHGHFSKDKQDGIPSLPAIEVLWLQGVPTGQVEFKQWAENNGRFLSSVGEEIFGYTAYRFDDIIVSIHGWRRDHWRKMWRIYLLGAPKDHGFDITEATDLCSTLQVWTMLLSFAESLDRRLHRLQALAARRQRELGLRRYFKLYANLIDDYTLFSRLKADTKRIVESTASKKLARFTQMTSAAGNEPVKLTAALNSSVKGYFKSLKMQAEATMTSTKEYLGLQNMRLIYFLQIAVLIISLFSAWVAYKALAQTGYSRGSQKTTTGADKKPLPKN